MATQIIMNEVAKLSELESIRVTVRESLKGGLMVGCAATAGSLFMGPVGLLIGGVLGSTLTSMSKWGKYRSLVSVIMEDLTPSQQEKLVQSLQVALQQVQKEDLLRLVMLVTAGGAQAAVREIMINTVKDYVVRELGMQLC